jgi:hypothetical protein
LDFEECPVRGFIREGFNKFFQASFERTELLFIAGPGCFQ